MPETDDVQGHLVPAYSLEPMCLTVIVSLQYFTMDYHVHSIDIPCSIVQIVFPSVDQA